MTNLRMLLEGGERARRDKDEADYFNVCVCVCECERERETERERESEGFLLQGV